MIDFAQVIAQQWYFTIPLLAATVTLLGWAMYRISGSLHVAATVTAGTFVVTGLALLDHAPALSTVSFILAVSVVFVLVVNELHIVNSKYNKQKGETK